MSPVNIGDDSPRERVLLHHATSKHVWEQIQAEGSMRASDEAYDWLGKGVYFWQAAPVRAWIWKRFLQIPVQKRAAKEDCVVLEYEMELDPATTIDLFDVRWIAPLAAIGSAIPGKWRLEGVPEDVVQRRLKRNSKITEPVPHFLDCAAITEVCNILRTRMEIQVVRAPFQHLDRLYPYSSFRSGDHVQVAVRDPRIIDVSRLRRVDGLAEIEAEYAPRRRTR